MIFMPHLAGSSNEDYTVGLELAQMSCLNGCFPIISLFVLLTLWSFSLVIQTTPLQEFRARFTASSSAVVVSRRGICGSTGLCV